MKLETAAKLLSIALEDDDLEALEVACQYRPWTMPRIMSDPLRIIGLRLDAARKSPADRIADIRSKIQPQLDILARHGFTPTGASLVAFGEFDTRSMLAFARTAHDFSEEHPANALFLHRLCSASKMHPSWIKPLVSLGFDPNHQDQAGNTPAHMVLEIIRETTGSKTLEQRLETLLALRNAGADFLLENRAGTSVADRLAQIADNLNNGARLAPLISDVIGDILDRDTSKSQTRPHSRRL